MSRYLAAVPVEIREALNRIRCGRRRCCSSRRGGRRRGTCSKSNPVLLWLVAERYAAEPEIRHQVPEVLQRHAAEGARVGAATGGAACAGAVRRADHAQHRRRGGTRDRASARGGRGGREEAAPTGRGYRPGCSRSSSRHLPWPNSTGSGRKLPGRGTSGLCGRIVESRRRFVRDTVRMLGVLRRDGDRGSYDIRQYRSWKSLKALHDRLIAAARQAGWGTLLDAELPATQGLPPAADPVG